MRILIGEDDEVSRKFLFKFLAQYGDCDVTVNGIEVIDAFLMALDEKDPYDIICLDVMMPRLDGIKALKIIRDLEVQKGFDISKRVKIIMTTALNEKNTMASSYESGCDAYIPKPIDTVKFTDVLNKLGLIG
jgi:two-component system chemotaxis response regulator CheY